MNSEFKDSDLDWLKIYSYITFIFNVLGCLSRLSSRRSNVISNQLGMTVGLSLIPDVVEYTSYLCTVAAYCEESYIVIENKCVFYLI